MNNFNLIAPVYDRLARLVFGNSIERATACFLGEIKKTDKVLVVGGGTGKMLKNFPECKEITWMDKSSTMISKARKKSTTNVVFLEEDFMRFQSSKKWNMIICPFFLDCFNDQNLRFVMEKISAMLTDRGILIVSDFQEGKSQPLMRFMHLFFRLFASLESKKLKNIHEFILEKGFSVEKEEFFNKSTIFSRVYGNL